MAEPKKESFFRRFLPPPAPQSGDDPQLGFKDRAKALRNLPPLFKLIWETSPAMTVSNLLLRLLRSALPLASLYTGKLIIDEIIFLAALTAPAVPDFSRLWLFIALEFAAVILSDILSRATALIDSLLGDRFSNATSVRLMQHAATLDLDMFEDALFYDKLERARQQTGGRITLMSQVLTQVQDSITMLFLAVGLIAFNPWLIALLVVTLVPAFLGEAHFNARSYALSFSRTPERRELDYIRYTGASDETAKEVKVFGLSLFLTDRFKTLSDKFYSENKSLSLRRAAWGLGLAAIASAGYYAAYAMIVLQTVNGNLSIGDLTFLAGSFARLRSLLEGILGRFASVADGALYLRDLFDFFEMKPRIAAPLKPRPFPKPILHGFVFENVGFKYQPNGKPAAPEAVSKNGNGATGNDATDIADDEPSAKPRERWANRHLSFTLKAGEKLALVGENGAGKTTLAKLFSRLYDPSEGRILLDGHDLREYDPIELRKEIGVIFQDFVRYQLTASDNIAIGRIGERTNRPRITDAATRSLAGGVIEKLPKGYEQMIGRKFSGGVDLSGGEWQKIALARAYMRDAQLLILDEPTAALDARAEHEVFQRFAELTEGKSAVLISHRFSTVRMADRILVLQNGEMLEIGTHEELLANGSKYAELFLLQAQGYR